MTPISFKANFIKNVNIQQFANSDKPQDKKVAIVELDRNNMFDKMAIRDTAIAWGKHGNNYAYGVADHMAKWEHKDKTHTDHYIAITKQKKDFAHLNSEKILGVALFTEKKNEMNELKWLQVDPKTKYRTKTPRQYKGIGKAIVEYIKTLSKQPFELFADPDAIPFYEKVGLKKQNHTNFMTYKTPFNFVQFCKDILSKL